MTPRRRPVRPGDWRVVALTPWACLAGGPLASCITPPSVPSAPEAEECLRIKLWEGKSDDWAVRASFTDELADGAHAVHSVMLYPGLRYRFLACADPGARDVDVLVYAGTDRIVARDATEDREPVVEFTTADVGTYDLVVYHRRAAEPRGLSAIATAVAYKR